MKSIIGGLFAFLPFLIGVFHKPFVPWVWWQVIWFLKGGFFFVLCSWLLGKRFFEQHRIMIQNYSFNSLYCYFILYFIGVMLLWTPYRWFSTSTLLSPILEEFVVRGFITQLNHKQYKYNYGLIFLTSISFGLMHFFWPCGMIDVVTWGHYFLKFKNHFAFSLTMSLIAYQYRRIDIPILLHMIFNFGTAF